MRKTILILPLFFSAFNLYSQDSLLRKFKYRINNYREINFNLGGAGQLYNRKFVTGDNESNSSNANLGVSYYTTKSTDRILLTVAGNASTSFSSAKAKDANYINKSRSFNASSQLSALNKWFRKNMFMELGADISENYTTNKSIQGNPSATSKNNMNGFSTAVNIGIGKGRLENITDMQNALWLYQSLQEEKRLSRSLSDDELNELGRTITLANNTRVLDARKRTQFILETTDNFFQQKKVLTANDIRYFTSLNDILFFAINNQRLSGTETFVRLTPEINISDRNESNTFPSTKNETGIVNRSALFSAGINKYIPVNLRHQNNYGFSLKLKYNSYDESNKFFTAGILINQFDLNSINRQAGINVFFQHAIYPNTRTIISFNLRSEGGYQHYEQESGFFGLADISASFNYFISYRTRFTCNLGTSYLKNIYSYTYYNSLELLPTSFQLYANAGLQVSL